MKDESGERRPDARPSQLPLRHPARSAPSNGGRAGENLTIGSFVVFLLLLAGGATIWPSMWWGVGLGLVLLAIYGSIAWWQLGTWRRHRKARAR